MKRIVHWWRRVFVVPAVFASVLLLVAACGGGKTETAVTAPGTSGGAPVTIKLWDGQWESLWINNALAKFLLEHGYGYKVETVELTTPVAQVSLARGDIDVWMEMTPTNWLDWYLKETATGNVIDLKDYPIMENQPQFFMVPKWFAEQHGIRTVEDMKKPEVFKALADPEDPSKGAFINCIIGWQCEAINAAKFRAYGLDQFYNIISPGSAGAMDAAIEAPAKRNEPVFAYYWSPTALMGRYDWYILEEPAYTEECWEEVQKGRNDHTYTPTIACAYVAPPVTKAVYKDMLTKAPDAVQLIDRVQVGLASINSLAAWANENNVTDWERAAVKFLRENEAIWTQWLPEDKANKVKEALAQAS